MAQARAARHDRGEDVGMTTVLATGSCHLARGGKRPDDPGAALGHDPFEEVDDIICGGEELIALRIQRRRPGSGRPSADRRSGRKRRTPRRQLVPTRRCHGRVRSPALAGSGTGVLQTRGHENEIVTLVWLGSVRVDCRRGVGGAAVRAEPGLVGRARVRADVQPGVCAGASGRDIDRAAHRESHVQLAR